MLKFLNNEFMYHGKCEGPAVGLAPLVAGAMGASSTVTTVMSLAGAALSLVGGMQEANAIEAEGDQARVDAQFTSDQLHQKAGQTRASAQRDLIATRRQQNLIRSSAVNKADNTLDVLPILAGIESEGDFRALNAMYQGEDAAIDLENRASGAIYEGDVAYKAARTKASATRKKAIASTVMSAGKGLSKYAPTYDPVSGSAGQSSSYFPDDNITVDWMGRGRR